MTLDQQRAFQERLAYYSRLRDYSHARVQNSIAQPLEIASM